MPQKADKGFAKPPPPPPKYDFRNIDGTDIANGEVWLFVANSDYKSTAETFRNHCKTWAKANGFKVKTQAVDRDENLITAEALKDLRSKSKREFGVKVKFWPEGTEEPGVQLGDDDEADESGSPDAPAAAAAA